MWSQFAENFRKLSWVIVGSGLMIMFFSEVFFDFPRKDGKPKPPIEEQRQIYWLVPGLGVPGAIWAMTRALRGQQRSPWEE